MAEDNDLEKRAIEELLRETDRARARAETMGPAGWLKCPLRSTNKRFLINTLRSTGLQRHTGEPTAECSTTRGRLGSESPERSRGHSRSPRRDHRNNGGQAEQKYHHRGLRRNEGKSHDRDRKQSHRHRDSREHANSKDQQKTEKHRH